MRLSQPFKYIICYGKPPLDLVSVIVFFTPIFFLTIKSWVTTSLFMLAIYCVWQVLKEPKKYFNSRGRLFWISFLCLILPFLCELIAQVGRQSLDGPGLDGASRSLLSSIVFVYLSKRNIEYRKFLVSAS